MRKAVIGFVSALALFLSVQPAAAQEKIEFAGGYQFLRFLDDGGANVSKGWGASVAGGEKIKLVGDIAGHYRDGFKLHTFQGGVDFGLSQQDKIRAFVRLLAGLGHFGDDDGDSANGFVFTPEVGVDIMGSNGVGARIAAGFPIHRLEGETEKTFRFFVGVVIK